LKRSRRCPGRSLGSRDGSPGGWWFNGRVSLENWDLTRENVDLTRENGDLSRENVDLMGYNWKIGENSQLKRNGYFFDLPRIIPQRTVDLYTMI